MLVIDYNPTVSKAVKSLKGETVMAEEETRKEDEAEKVESLKVKSNIKAGGDPPIGDGGAHGAEIPIIPPG